MSEATPLSLWSPVRGGPTVADVTKVRDDKQFATRLGNVLRELRDIAGKAEPDEDWTQEGAAEKIDVPLSTLGHWERGENAPKGYDLGRLYRAYERFGARWEWFFDPPEVVVTNPVREHLARLARGATAAALEDRAPARAKHRPAAKRRAAPRDKQPS